MASGADLRSVLTDIYRHSFAGVVRSFFQQFGPVVEVRKPYGILRHRCGRIPALEGVDFSFRYSFRVSTPFIRFVQLDTHNNCDLADQLSLFSALSGAGDARSPQPSVSRLRIYHFSAR